MSDEKNVPKIRFPGFTEPWEQRKLEDFGKATGGTSIESEFSEDGVYKVISIGSYSENSVYNDQGIRAIKSDKTSNRVLNRNDLTMILNDKTTSGNIIGRVLLIEESGIYVYNQRTERIEINLDEFNPVFLYEMLNAPNIREKIIKQAQGNTQIYVNWTTISLLEYMIPSKEEQVKIGEHLHGISNLITLHQRKLEHVKKMKKSMLQKMFPKKNQLYPEVRFPGFTDAWEQRKYAEVIELLSGQDFNPEEYNEDGIGIPYLTGASCIENGCTTAVRWTEKPRCIAEKGDTVLVCKGSGYGTIATVNQEKAHIARQFMALKVKKHELDNRFNYFLLNSVVENIKTDARGLIAGIARDAVLKQEIVIPCLSEQTKIGEYFENLDHLITLHQRKQNGRNLK